MRQRAGWTRYTFTSCRSAPRHRQDAPADTREACDRRDAESPPGIMDLPAGFPASPQQSKYSSNSCGCGRSLSSLSSTVRL